MRVREKKEYVIFTFHTTAAAMATEKLCQERSIPGRLIPRAAEHHRRLRHRVGRAAGGTRAH